MCIVSVIFKNKLGFETFSRNNDSKLNITKRRMLMDPRVNEYFDKIKEKYKDYLYIIVIAENEGLIKYYSQNGFQQGDGSYVFEIMNK